jgi:hypothetical protein
VSGAKTPAPAGLKFSAAQVKLVGPGELGAGLLLGLAAAIKPDSQALSALSFSFLQLPTSSSVAVDMPVINMDQVKYQPQAVVRSSVTASGGAVNQATCPDFTATVSGPARPAGARRGPCCS